MCKSLQLNDGYIKVATTQFSTPKRERKEKKPANDGAGDTVENLSTLVRGRRRRRRVLEILPPPALAPADQGGALLRDRGRDPGRDGPSPEPAAARQQERRRRWRRRRRPRSRPRGAARGLWPQLAQPLLRGKKQAGDVAGAAAFPAERPEDAGVLFDGAARRGIARGRREVERGVFFRFFCFFSLPNAAALACKPFHDGSPPPPGRMRSPSH